MAKKRAYKETISFPAKSRSYSTAYYPHFVGKSTHSKLEVLLAEVKAIQGLLLSLAKIGTLYQAARGVVIPFNPHFKAVEARSDMAARGVYLLSRETKEMTQVMLGSEEALTQVYLKSAYSICFQVKNAFLYSHCLAQYLMSLGARAAAVEPVLQLYLLLLDFFDSQKGGDAYYMLEQLTKSSFESSDHEYCKSLYDELCLCLDASKHEFNSHATRLRMALPFYDMSSRIEEGESLYLDARPERDYTEQFVIKNRVMVADVKEVIKKIESRVQSTAFLSAGSGGRKSRKRDLSGNKVFSFFCSDDESEYADVDFAAILNK